VRWRIWPSHQVHLASTDVLARYGGEEFIIIMPETEREEAVLVMTRVQRELTAIFPAQQRARADDLQRRVAQRQSAEGADAVMKRADMALYQAKQAGATA